MSKRKKTREQRTSYLPWKQAQVLLKCLVADRKYNVAFMVGFGIYTGLRIGDILARTWKEVKKDRFTITEQKTGKRREIIMTPDLVKLRDLALSDFPANRQPPGSHFVFIPQRPVKGSEPGTSQLSLNAANKRIKSALADCGIKTQNPSSHTLRKTFGRQLWESHGRSEEALITLSELFNHDSTATTRGYLDIKREELAEACLSLSGDLSAWMETDNSK